MDRERPRQSRQFANQTVSTDVNGVEISSGTVAGLENLPWKRLSPLTPVLNNIGFFGAALVFLLIKEYDLLIWWWEQEDKLSLSLLLSVFGIIGLIVLAVILYSIWSWYWSGYYLGKTHFYFRKGKIFKDQRQVPLDRVQGVQQSQPLIAQLSRLYKVHIESAGGRESHVDVAYVGAKEAEYLVSEISRRSHLQRSGAEDAATPAFQSGTLLDTARKDELPVQDRLTQNLPAQNPPTQRKQLETKLLQIQNKNLIIANLLDTRKLILLVIYLISLGTALIYELFSGKNPFSLNYWLEDARLYPLIIFTITCFGTVISPLLKNFNTCTWSAAKGIKSSRGLTTITRSYLPYDRIHGFTFQQSLLWRLFGWWKGNLIAAGRTNENSEKKPDADEVIPVGSEQDLHNILDITMPDLDNSVKNELLKEIINSDLKFSGWVGIKPGARWLSPFDGGVEGIKYTDRALVRKWGLIDKRGVIVPLSHVQNVTVEQGPLARLLGVATVTAYLVKNTKQPFVRMSLLPADRAIQVTAELNQLVLANMKPLKETLGERF